MQPFTAEAFERDCSSFSRGLQVTTPKHATVQPQTLVVLALLEESPLDRYLPVIAVPVPNNPDSKYEPF